MKYFSMAFISVFVLFSCSSDENNNDFDDGFFPDIEPTTVRLKHLLTTSEVVNELGNYTTGWKVKDLNVTNVGEYPTFPYIYSYTLGMEEIPESAVETRSISAQAGGSVDADVPGELSLAESDTYIPVHPVLLFSYPYTHIVRRSAYAYDYWLGYLDTHHIDKRGNQEIHSIRLYGLRTPPPVDAVAVM